MPNSHRLIRISLITAVLVACLVVPTRAQTPTTTVKDASGTVVLQSNADGGLLAPGTFVGSGVPETSNLIPATGAGTRLMWYPAKAAFRAGQVGREKDGTQWDANNIGEFSAAFGVDTQANNFAATAMGNKTTASGGSSTAMGSQTTAGPGSAAVAMGFSTTASGNGSTAMGLSTIAATSYSLTIGTFNDQNRGQDDSDPGTGPLFVVGNGDNSNLPDSRSDALVLDRQGNLTVNGLSQSSDRRLKTDIEPLEEGTLKKLSTLRPVRYEFKDQSTYPSGEQVGLIAQEVQKEFPTLVSEGSGGYLSLSYPKMTAHLLKGLQEQQSQLNKLKAQNEALRNRVDQIENLKDRLAAVEAERFPSAIAGRTGSSLGLLLAFLLGGLLGAGLLWRRRN